MIYPDEIQPADAPAASGQGPAAAEESAQEPTVYSVPRRFSIATIMIMMVLYGGILGAYRAIVGNANVSHMEIGAIVFFVCWIAACQPILYRGRKPREASVVGGAVFGGVTATILTYSNMRWPAMAPLEMLLNAVAIPLAVAPLGMPIGAILGYLAGVGLAGVFLLMAAAERHWPATRVIFGNPSAEPQSDEPSCPLDRPD